MPSILRKHFLDIIVASFINLIVCTLMWWFISNSSPKLSFALILVIVGFEVNEKNYPRLLGYTYILYVDCNFN